MPPRLSNEPSSPGGDFSSFAGGVAAGLDARQEGFDAFGPAGDTLSLEPGWLAKVGERLGRIKDNGKRAFGAVALVGAGLGLGVFGNAVAGESDSSLADMLEAASASATDSTKAPDAPVDVTSGRSGGLAEGLGETESIVNEDELFVVSYDEEPFFRIREDMSPAEKAELGLHNAILAAKYENPDAIRLTGDNALASARRVLAEFGPEHDPEFDIRRIDPKYFTEVRTPDGVYTLHGQAHLTTNPLDANTLKPVDRQDQGLRTVELTFTPSADADGLTVSSIVFTESATDGKTAKPPLGQGG